MERNKPVVYDDVAITNMARAARAKLIARTFRRLGQWVAGNRAGHLLGNGTRAA